MSTHPEQLGWWISSKPHRSWQPPDHCKRRRKWRKISKKRWIIKARWRILFLEEAHRLEMYDHVWNHLNLQHCESFRPQQHSSTKATRIWECSPLARNPKHPILQPWHLQSWWTPCHHLGAVLCSWSSSDVLGSPPWVGKGDMLRMSGVKWTKKSSHVSRRNMNNLPPVRSFLPKTWPKHTNDRWACGSCQSCPILRLPATTVHFN